MYKNKKNLFHKSPGLLIKVAILLCVPGFSLPISAQIIPDASLPVNTGVNTNKNVVTITGGTRAGTNLFHSFQEFSIPTRGIVYFNNSADIQNIINRVTGSSISNINGLIRANGTANLFLINSNGIIFGPNSSLAIGGSFLGTTATSIVFADNNIFSTKLTGATPLLTINLPTGLQFGRNPGEISVTGLGQNLNGFANLPVTGFSNSSGLQLQPGKTLALVGGNIFLEGGILTAPGGRIEIGSVDSGLVRLNYTTSGWGFGYEEVSDFNDIKLSSRSLVNTSGFGSGLINIQGGNISLSNGSVIINQNRGRLSSGTINVNGSKLINISGTDPIATIISGLWSETSRDGNAADINISTPNLVLQDGGLITSRTYGPGGGGNIDVKASNLIQVTGGSPITPRAVSNISSLSGSLSATSGKAGDIFLSTGKLIVDEGGNVISLTTGAGAGGNVTINATDSVEVTGVQPKIFLPTSISAATFGSGKAGQLIINTSKLMLTNGGRIDSSTIADGLAGSININASDFIEVSSPFPKSTIFSTLDSSAGKFDPSIVKIVGQPEELAGRSGNITLNTRQLRVTNGGTISVKDDGLNNAGTLTVNAHSIFLDSKGNITATAASNQGGNIFLNAQDLQLHNSSISATATSGNGNGGNVTINTDTLLVIQNSKVTARANNGNGGRITVKTQGFVTDQGFFSSSNKPSNLSKVFDASSNFGVNGNIQVNIPPEVNVARASANPTPVLQSPEVSSICASKKDTANSFISTGSGGNPPNPSETISSDNGWQHNTLSTQNQEKSKLKKQTSVEDELLIPATGVEFSPDGKMMRFISDSSGDISSSSEAGCSEAKK